ncbi:MAG: N-acetylmuramoyl-L-alanine amidase, partial [Muribaculaceae bacterium]|nr:N-acetylmuramoyl-L-alanine amidase [Muribaculaceae bacterium]
PAMGERKQIWRDAQVNIAISVHNNSGGGALDSPGTAVLYKHLSDRPFASFLMTRMLETGLPMFGLVGNFNFSLNGPTEFPNALIEGMFMSSLQEEEKLADPDFRRLVAEKIVAGLEDYLKSAK